MNEIIVFTHSDCLLKDNGSNHPERKERLQTVLKSIEEATNIDTDIKEAPLINLDNVYLVHPEKYIKYIFYKIFLYTRI